MTIAHHAPGKVPAPARDSLPSAIISPSLRNVATVLVSILTITVIVLLALVFTGSESTEIHDSWMNAQPQIEEVFNF